jgi:hypothetical protein
MNTNRTRGLCAGGCFLLATLAFLCGWFIPAHLRAIPESVLQRAGEGRTSLRDRAVELQRVPNLGAARLLLKAAQDEGIPSTGSPASILSAQSENRPLFPGGPTVPSSMPVTAWVIGRENRQRVLAHLEGLSSPVVREWVRDRDLTNTVLFPASSSASGQAFDAALLVGGLLLAGDDLSPNLRDALVERAAFARTHPDAEPLEEMLLDLLSLGQRLTWEQLTVFVSRVDSPGTLTLLADQARNAGAQFPVLYAAVVLSQNPKQVAAYLNDFSQTGLQDLGASLRYGQGGLEAVLQRHQRVYLARLHQPRAGGPLAGYVRAASDCTLRTPWLALTVKWGCYLLAGFLLAAAGQFGRPSVLPRKEGLRVRGFYLARGLLFALGFLLVVLLLSEPFLAQESQKAEFAFRLRLPLAGAAAPGTMPLARQILMDTRSLLDTRSLFTLLLFFVLQGLIYCACLVKLAEVRRQNVPARVRLKLLENEEHLFDAGLYLGFAGTIVCLILVSLGIIQQSLMAAYSSTSFGIIFVSIFKIFNLRPVRRQLLLQAEEQAAVPEQRVTSTASLAANV